MITTEDSYLLLDKEMGPRIERETPRDDVLALENYATVTHL